jgi:hypothetical protein
LQNPPLGCPSGNWRLTTLWETVSDAPVWNHPRCQDKQKLLTWWKLSRVNCTSTMRWHCKNLYDSVRLSEWYTELVRVIYIQKLAQTATINYWWSTECLWPIWV